MAVAADFDTVPHEAILLELKRVLRSRSFSQSIRLCRFLRFTIEYTIAGKADLLKEYLIGCEVYDRRPPYDPAVDSIVRTEAHRLRAKLDHYYGNEGKKNPVRIYFSVGKYVPSFVYCPAADGTSCLAEAGSNGLPLEANRVLIGTQPFHDSAQTAMSAAFTEGLSEEIAHVLMRRGLRSVTADSSRQGSDCVLPNELVPLCSDFRLEGSIREVDGCLSVMVKLIRPDRMRIA